LEGITITPNEKDISEVEALITGPKDTPFEDGVFRVKLKMGADFPQAPPKGYFLTKIFHPNVAEGSGEICVNTLKKDWKESYGIKHILLTIKCLLIVPNPESALNEEAGRLLLDQYEDYFARAKTYTAIHAKATPTITTGTPAPVPSTATTTTTTTTSSSSPGTVEESEGSKENQSVNTNTAQPTTAQNPKLAQTGAQTKQAKKPPSNNNKPKRGVKRL